jgi:uncharacterized membrane protein YeaQ/YmgE (transglycosylase-associated protein family)
MLIGIFAWIVFGFVVGLVARAVMPGDQPMGFLKTTALGVGGSFVGGFIGHALFHPSWSHWGQHADTAGFIGSVIGALVILFIAGVARR